MADGASTGTEAGSATARGGTRRIELGKREQAFARRLAESKATIPHLTAHRAAAASSLPHAGDELLATLAVAAAAALAEHPRLNSRWRDGGIEERDRINVGFVAETPEGPLVPVLADADRLDEPQALARIAELRKAAEGGELAAPALAGGTFTVTVIDGADSLEPIVLPGQAAHLAAGRRTGPNERARLELTLACDARVVRPPLAGSFLESLVRRLGSGHP